MDKTKTAPRFRHDYGEPLKLSVGSEKHEHRALIQDISSSGLSLCTLKELPAKVGDQVFLEMAPLGGPAMACNATIVREQIVDGARVLGLKFQNIPLLYQERLDSLIRTALFSKRMNEFVTLQSAKGVIALDYTQRVKRLMWLLLIGACIVFETIWIR